MNDKMTVTLFFIINHVLSTQLSNSLFSETA